MIMSVIQYQYNAWLIQTWETGIVFRATAIPCDVPRQVLENVMVTFLWVYASEHGSA